MIGVKKIAGLKTKIKVYKKTKIFCIGANKTGTTSLKSAMVNDLGYISGSQSKGEKLLRAWALRDFDEIVKHCYSAQFFQDIPFSLPFTFILLDQTFPNSKFILTQRDDSEQWYASLTRFHSQIWGENGRIPTKEDLQRASYVKKGWPWEANRSIFDTPMHDPYNKKILVEFYNNHNESVREYFRHRPQDLLVLNIAEDGAFQKLCEFLGVKSARQNFPWKNRSSKTCI